MEQGWKWGFLQEHGTVQSVSRTWNQGVERDPFMEAPAAGAEVRMAEVKRLKLAIQEGSYRVASSNLADALIRHMLVSR